VSNFSGILDGYLKRKAEVGRPAIARWRGSLLGACVRQQWYAAEKVEPTNPFPDNLYRIFERGHAVAEILNKAGRDALEAGELLDFQEEVPVLLPEYEFSGNVDALVKWPDGTHEVWEYKSTTNRGMQYIREVKPEHAVQASIYAAAEDFKLLEFKLDRGWRDRAIRVLKVLQYFGKRKPPRLPSRRGKDMKAEWPCKGCKWLKECRG
jgi:hypothetical protein